MDWLWIFVIASIISLGPAVYEGCYYYHATDCDNIEAIMKHGLEARDTTRAITNRNIGSGVFASSEIGEIEKSRPMGKLK